jgi:hypothetical protein
MHREVNITPLYQGQPVLPKQVRTAEFKVYPHKLKLILPDVQYKIPGRRRIFKRQISVDVDGVLISLLDDTPIAVLSTLKVSLYSGETLTLCFADHIISPY